jgi:hypothetical protein
MTTRNNYMEAHPTKFAYRTEHADHRHITKAQTRLKNLSRESSLDRARGTPWSLPHVYPSQGRYMYDRYIRLYPFRIRANGKDSIVSEI